MRSGESQSMSPCIVCPAKTGKDKPIMSEQITDNFLMPPPLIDYAELYRELFSGVENYLHLGEKLIQLAEQAHSFRQFERVRKYGEILSDIPLKNYQAVGIYFQAV